MTTLLDTPLPQLHPPARPWGGPLDTPTELAPSRPGGSARQTGNAPAPLRPPPVRRPAVQPSRRQRVAAPSTAPCPTSRFADASPAATTVGALRRPLRLTRRARLLVTLMSTVGMLAIVGLAALNAGSGGSGLRDAPASVVVQTGDTLWQIAVDVAPAEDPAVVVEMLRSANDLGGAPLQPGQVLVVPRGY